MNTGTHLSAVEWLIQKHFENSSSSSSNHHSHVASKGGRVIAPLCLRPTACLHRSPTVPVESSRSWSSHLGGWRHIQLSGRHQSCWLPSADIAQYQRPRFPSTATALQLYGLLQSVFPSNRPGLEHSGNCPATASYYICIQELPRYPLAFLFACSYFLKYGVLNRCVIVLRVRSHSQQKMNDEDDDWC